MIDPEKTENLREKLKKINNENVDNQRVKRAEKAIKNFFFLITRVVMLHLSQIIVLNHYGLIPFRWWETTIIYFGISAVSALFKKSE